MTLLIIFCAWLAVGAAMHYRIRQNRRRYRMERAHRSVNAWLKGNGGWFEEEQ
jgi:hypothetical protein